MSHVSMKALLESGVHFGHRTHRWNPHMKPYIFTQRNGIHILDLQQTVKAMDEVYEVVRNAVAEGKEIMFVGTKRQAQETIEMEASRCGMPYVTVRWLGGMLTNWRTMRQRINELERLERMRDRGDFDLITKKEALGLTRQIEKLDLIFGGSRNMAKLPDLVFVIDVRREETAILEANRLEIPIIGMVDTNCDPSNIDYVIPSNDDAIRAIKLVVGFIADAVLEGKAMRKDEEDFIPSAETVMKASEEASELSDEELLGKSTLDKISSQVVEEELTAVSEEITVEETASDEEETQEETSETVKEEE